ncbi:unnamed protein product [Prorocentrum cordatum]|uniref:Uncharacterized protein n=1 Tax=Prorocentrum cordatum TaxID=2364126 RepID=A0ABN9RUR2_9DINO|nr:unnamed protein product [Polarella glacialis]
MRARSEPAAAALGQEEADRGVGGGSARRRPAAAPLLLGRVLLQPLEPLPSTGSCRPLLEDDEDTARGGAAVPKGTAASREEPGLEGERRVAATCSSLSGARPRGGSEACMESRRTSQRCLPGTHLSTLPRRPFSSGRPFRLITRTASPRLNRPAPSGSLDRGSTLDLSTTFSTGRSLDCAAAAVHNDAAASRHQVLEAFLGQPRGQKIHAPPGEPLHGEEELVSDFLHEGLDGCRRLHRDLLLHVVGGPGNIRYPGAPKRAARKRGDSAP